MLKFEIYEIDGEEYIKLEDLKKSIKEISSETKLDALLLQKADPITIENVIKREITWGLALTLIQENIPHITKEEGVDPRGVQYYLYTSRIYLLDV